jgi:thioredoxin reductase
VRDQPLGVLGSNPAAILHAQLLRQWSENVIYFAHTNEPSSAEAAALHARGISIVYGEVARLVVQEEHLAGVELTDGNIVPRCAVFVRPITAPHPDDLLTKLGCELDDAGFAVVDHTGRTSVAGVWGAGNAVDIRAQVITAAGAGSAAAIAINAELVQDDIALALHAVR